MRELTIPFHETAPLYEQIYEYIKAQILEEKLLAGTRLPSTRKLAEHLGVSRSTTQLAYDQLVAEGYLQSEPCRGYFVSKLETLFHMETKSGQIQKQKIEKKEPWLVDFSPRGIDLERFPYALWRRLSRESLNDDNRELFSTGEHKGDECLRQAVCTYLYGARGVFCRPEQLIIGAGNEYLLMLLHQLLGNQIIAMETPTYRQAFLTFKRLGNQVIPVEMDENGMKAEALAHSGAGMAYVMPSHQFPMGIVMPIRRRMELLAWAAEAEGRYLIEDDYDSEFRYKGKPIPSLQSADVKGRVIYLGTFSRAVAPAIRVSYMMLPESLLARYEKNCSFYASTVSRIDQRILARFIDEGHYERHLNRMRGVYKAKHDALLAALSPLSGKYVICGAYAGIHILLESRQGQREQDMVQAAEAAGIRVYGLSEFAIEKEETDRAEKKTETEENKEEEKTKMRSGTILLGYANLKREEIEQGARLLVAALLA
ncbi:MAG: PLP-dependent aminotransferase family protein [Lachnospiraceae bacterium]|nr:PLP-dependent aminotransferase family protein [Lachnospiraceae bacterium]